MEHGHHPKTVDHHEHPHEHGPRLLERRRLKVVAILTGSMMVVEAIGGIITNSLALLSDAFHMLTHFGALLMWKGMTIKKNTNTVLSKVL